MQSSADLDAPGPAPARPGRPQPEHRRGRPGHRRREQLLWEAAARSERRRLAREIHDQLGATLALTLRFLELAELTGESDPAAARSHARRAREGVDQAIRDARSLITDLGDRPGSPPAPPSLRREIQGFLRAADPVGLDVHIRVTGDERGTDPALRQEGFLIIREALRNVLAHAGASQAWVDARFSHGELRAGVRDDGTGFPATTGRSARYGLTAMRERAESVGGTVTVDSSPHHGTRVELVLPAPTGRRARR
ncbi:sensor histidine kinase [Streptacidiphilus sp. P02-A3a]|uniref:sensor histidine kinase n=1 Tax=Streptacidiphilus sp. P02-A3a TaxID=2704468 RepID=UPI0015FB69BD|nr:histidine kinase [Streptacidiphilus sp. P02-A3a]QMU73269.1 hypothetical protein GXP74_38590 [Streptacidiphilus sp. P02-A3a]